MVKSNGVMHCPAHIHSTTGVVCAFSLNLNPGVVKMNHKRYMPVLSNTQLERLRNILSYRRPHGSKTERRFTYEHVASLPDAWEDYHGNIHVEIGVNNRVLFSCHTDTVHNTGGRQTVVYDKGWLRRKASASDCLGAKTRWLGLIRHHAMAPMKNKPAMT